MSDDETEVPESHEHHPVKQHSGGSGAFLATLLVALAALGGGYYLWQQQQLMKKDAHALEDGIDKLLGVMEQRHQQQLERFKTVPAHSHSQLDSATQQNAGKIDKLEQLVYDLRNRQGQERRGWVVAEAEYLLRIAEHRLTLEHDTHTAIAALRTARSRLELQNNPLFAKVIDRIGDDINKLAAIELPDRNALANQIAALAAGVEALPLAIGTLQSSATTAAATSEQPLSDDSWKAIWQKVWRDIRGLVTIRREGESRQPMFVPEQRYFLKQNLQLKLESARLALLAGNAGAWRASLEGAADWLRRYFDISALPVNSAIDTLQRLARTELQPPLPGLADTRRLLQQAAMQPETRPQEATTPASPATEPPPAPAAEKESAQPAADSAQLPVETPTPPAVDEPASAEPAPAASEQGDEAGLPAEEAAPADEVPQPSQDLSL